MVSTTFDTHLLVRHLKDKGMPEEQAEVVMSIMRESYHDAVSDSVSKSEISALATKEDLPSPQNKHRIAAVDEWVDYSHCCRPCH